MLLLCALLVSCVWARVIIVSPQVPAWTTETVYAPLEVFVGDSLTFRYAAGEHNVVRFPSQQTWEYCAPETTPGLQLLCGNWENLRRRNVETDSANATTHKHARQGGFEECTVQFNTPGTFYYACTHDFGPAFLPQAHCVLGQRIKVTVRPVLACLNAGKRRSLISSTHKHKRTGTNYQITPVLGWAADVSYTDLAISVGDSLRFDFIWTHDVVYTQNQGLYDTCDFSACTFPGTICPGTTNSWTTLAHPIPPQNLVRNRENNARLVWQVNSFPLSF